MEISLNSISKKYIREWIVSDLSHTFPENSSTAIVGPNGSGKSTLLKLISGIAPVSKGNISYMKNGIAVPVDDSFRHFSFCAPYQALVEELTLQEMIKFHLGFRRMALGDDVPRIAEVLQLAHALHKPIYFFSSGMKQRLRLGLALLTMAEVTYLDEPTANLDKRGIDWYYKLIDGVKGSRSLIIASNQEHEYAFCEKIIDLTLK